MTQYIHLINSDDIGLENVVTGNTKPFYLLDSSNVGTVTITFDYVIIRTIDTNNE